MIIEYAGDVAKQIPWLNLHEFCWPCYKILDTILSFFPKIIIVKLFLLCWFIGSWPNSIQSYSYCWSGASCV